MEPGAVISPNDGEVFKCVRSAKDGGTFAFELELDAGTDGPPTHSHLDPEIVEIVSGECLFWLNRKEHHLRAGDRLEIPPGVPHTFKVLGKEKLVGRGEHGGRFERAIDQFAGGGPGFTRLAMHLTYVDPHASYMKSPLVRALLRVIALVGRVRGISPI